MERNVEVTWATVDGVSTYDSATGEHDIFHDRSLAYSRAFYFVIVVISTCGYGDIRPYTNLETVFAQFVTLGGALGLASMVGTFLFYFQYIDLSGTTGKYSKRRRSNVAVIIDGIVFISSFLFYCLLFNHSFQTNPNKITNCLKLFSLYYNLQLHCSCVAF